MPEKSTMELIFLIRQLMERYREPKKDRYVIFIDLEKIYDKIPRISYDGRLKRNESLQNTLPLFRIYTQILRPMSEHVTASPMYFLLR
jgi:hypothetical protein